MQSYSQVFGAAKIKFSMHLCQQFIEISIDASAEYLPKLRQILQMVRLNSVKNTNFGLDNKK